MKIKPTLFEFVSFEFNSKEREAKFHYKIEFENREPLEFTETLIFENEFENYSLDYLNNVLKSTHIMLGISYYKLYCPAAFKLNNPIDLEQAEFWHKVYKKGLGEFLYQNNLSPNIIPEFPSAETINKPARTERKNRSLVGIGGGKDSIVTGELLKENDRYFTGLLIETQKEYPIARKVIEVMEIDGLYVKRLLDPKIFIDHPDSYNGHIPISAVFAFIGLITATLYDYRYVIVSNEHSSNFGNLEYKGLEINHQWSKSAEFEHMFQNYVEKFIGTGTKYFSALRPFYEIRIVKMFSEYSKYFPYFSSCNNAYKIYQQRSEKPWCGNCSKCVFAFTLLSAFLNKKEITSIFGENLYEREDLLMEFRDILGLGEMKPFDCVGTFEECQTAMLIAKDYKDDYIVKELSSEIEKSEEVFRTSPAPNIPEKFWNLGMESVYILGYGIEGKATERYVQKNYPGSEIVIGDQSLDENYLENQINYDFAFKTPGIHKSKVQIPYTTATNIFFSKYRDQIIGITGSKGKSTTTSLIYEIFKEAGKPVRLLGNIGNPMLDATNIKNDEILVVELSSYQLDDIKYSPRVAVLTNLFPEHMDFHEGIDNYYAAKKNIVNFQTESDHFICNIDEIQWQPESTVIDYNEEKEFETQLVGQHNIQNIKAAATVARLFKIPEKVIEKAVANFKGLPHRLEFIGEFQGINFYDDAISTTPESTIEAIKALKNIGTIFLGGEDRGYHFENLEAAIRKAGIKNIVLFPNSGDRIISRKKDLNIFETDSMEEAVKFAYQNTQEGQTCLLSCASPSYSLWKNYEEKGEQFKKFVQGLQ